MVSWLVGQLVSWTGNAGNAGKLGKAGAKRTAPDDV